MKTFSEFLEEGKKKKEFEKLTRKIERSVSKSVKNQRKEGEIPIADYGDAPAGSPERKAAIEAMMNRDSKGRKEMKRNQAG
jgi:hypothetical protein